MNVVHIHEPHRPVRVEYKDKPRHSEAELARRRSLERVRAITSGTTHKPTHTRERATGELLFVLVASLGIIAYLVR